MFDEVEKPDLIFFQLHVLLNDKNIDFKQQEGEDRNILSVAHSKHSLLH